MHPKKLFKKFHVVSMAHGQGQVSHIFKMQNASHDHIPFRGRMAVNVLFKNLMKCSERKHLKVKVETAGGLDHGSLIRAV